MEKEENVKQSNIKYKSFLIITKYFPHISAFMYVIYTLLQFAGIDPIILGYLLDYSLIPWLYMYLTSYIFRYCYVHRLPLYYILINEILTITDYYVGIPLNNFSLLLLHLLFIALLIYGYSFYYIKYKLKHEFHKNNGT